MTQTMLGRWDPWYQRLPSGAAPMPYGHSSSYQRGAEWLAGCALVEDWGCGTGWLRTLIPPDRYRGIDGSASPFADLVADLATYRSRVPGVFMRHVLEHNRDWPAVLDNALASFTKRMVLVLFTPMAEQTHELTDLEGGGGIDVPAISFRHEDIVGRFHGLGWAHEDITSPETWFQTERIYYLERQPPMERIPAVGWEFYTGHVERYTYAAAKVRPGEVVNDVACGVGYGAALLGPAAGAYRGYERPGVPDHRFAVGAVTFHACDLDDPTWRPEEADVTVCHATLEHVKDPWHLAATLATTTRHALVVSVPTEPTKHENPWHLHDFTVDDIPPMFPGFEVAHRWHQPDELGHVWTLERERGGSSA